MKTGHPNKPNLFKDISIVITCLLAVMTLAGCQKEGTAEKAGKKVDDAAKNVENKFEQIKDNADKKLDAAKESFDQKTSQAGEYIDKSTESSKESLEQANNELNDAKASVKDRAESTGEYIDDSVITLKVKTAILNDPTFKGQQSQISVTTVNGVVTLSGTVDSEPSIGRALELTNNQKNVKSVVIDLEVDANKASKK
jgi:hyperosmotically inducible periplasmic protein